MLAKTRNVGLLLIAELLAMGLWFSASAVVPQLTRQWRLDGGQQSWLTMSVQTGFVAGALVSAWLNLSDRIEANRLHAASAFLGAVANAGIAAGGGFREASRMHRGWPRTGSRSYAAAEAGKAILHRSRQDDLAIMNRTPEIRASSFSRTGRLVHGTEASRPRG
ncbi:MAG: hypothetical protein LAO51_03260 [Acidobacteriia bacterium]|nr:hypothetical protein [Terriglobia bacterium]